MPTENPLTPTEIAMITILTPIIAGGLLYLYRRLKPPSPFDLGDFDQLEEHMLDGVTHNQLELAKNSPKLIRYIQLRESGSDDEAFKLIKSFSKAEAYWASKYVDERHDKRTRAKK